ncbi:hypothetical protein [uncultured Kordia sp.]|uniref:hypothetical protein n=1 Tax=uncultured Kordia sp. TaxID=507699 RepID=UPI002631E38B|nr:hypothetical protein [uncultured Kordia sp.]
MSPQEISNIEIRIQRENKAETNKILVYATAWTTIPNLKFKDFENKDLNNINIIWEDLDLKLLELKLYLIPDDGNEPPVRRFYAINYFLEIINNENAKFEFNNKDNNVLLTKVSMKVGTADPTGTKRTVITYEDTDIIDDTDK